MLTERLSFARLASISSCLALALLAHITTLPLWVMLLVAGCIALRLALSYTGRATLPRGTLPAIAILVTALLFARFRTFNGLAAGTALLALMAGLKLLESKTQRDLYIIALIIYFAGVSALLESDSFWLLAYLIGVCWVTTVAMLRLTTSQAGLTWTASARYGGRILAQALPLAIVFWLLFPRLSTPMWRTPLGTEIATTGLGDSMSPGDITQLANSDEVAFRVHFAAAVPPASQRYWRGPVMHDFDGRTWRGAAHGPLTGPPMQMQGPSYRYTVNLEPHSHNWLFVLDYPAEWNIQRAGLNADYTLLQAEIVARPLDVQATSFPEAISQGQLGKYERTRDTRLPVKRNPRAVEFAHHLRAAHPDDLDFVQAVLQKFANEPYYYTLTPPKLADDSVDDFLFNTKRGFCGHYASAFAALARAAGIPTRIVTGYQGGMFNQFGDYWMVRQSNAHAWDEVWIDSRGWVRVDPTSVIAPARIEREVSNAESANEPLTGQRRLPWLLEARLRLDALRALWRERILSYDQNSQDRLLEVLHVPEPDGQKLVVLLAVALVAILAWLTWQVRRELEPQPGDAAVKAYARMCAKLARIGCPRQPFEGPEGYAARIALARPDLAPGVTALCRHYAALRYAAPPAHISATQLARAVRAFRPAKSRAAAR